MVKKVTKEELVKKCANLEAQNMSLSSKDAEVRREFSELLENVVYMGDPFNYGPKRTVATGSWLRIAFLIGELKADADYSCLLQARDNLKAHNAKLQQELDELKSEKK